MKNVEIALLLYQIADFFEATKNRFRARAYRKAANVNCQPYRLDLKDEYCIKAKNLGIKIAISSDAHSLRGFKFIELGISQAQRAGLEAKDVINTYTLCDMKKLLRKI